MTDADRVAIKIGNQNAVVYDVKNQEEQIIEALRKAIDLQTSLSKKGRKFEWGAYLLAALVAAVCSAST
ncbi:hypothetical protein MMC34_008498 [Xylographa carneopallida]|nr:hypothetical protein [Xylographa carneopallida]